MNKLSLTKEKEVKQQMKLFFMTQIPLKKFERIVSFLQYEFSLRIDEKL